MSTFMILSTLDECAIIIPQIDECWDSGLEAKANAHLEASGTRQLPNGTPLQINSHVCVTVESGVID